MDFLSARRNLSMKRLKRTLKWTGIILGGLVAIGLIANAILFWFTDSRLERQLAEIRAAGDPVTLADLARPPIPPEKNAATYLRRAEAGMAAIEKETMHVHSVSECPGFLLPLEDQKIVKAAFIAYPNVIPLLEQAAACPDYDAQLDYTLPPQDFLTKMIDYMGKVRSPGRVLGYRAAVQLAAGNRDEVVRTALLIFRLARHFDHNPMIMDYLMSLAVRGYAIRSANEALQTGPVSKEVRDALDAELAIQQRMEGFVWALKSERPYVVESFGNIPGGNLSFIGRGFWNMQRSACLDLFPTLIALAGDPRPYRQVEQTIDAKGKKSIMASLMFPALKAAYNSVARVKALIRSLRVLNALQTHVAAGSDAVPKLTDLGLPAEAITDPFNGEPLHVKKIPQGWLVYSVGPNLQDDGGKVDDPNNGDVGVGPPLPLAKPGKDH
jgi:HAMP domain-containing protein